MTAQDLIDSPIGPLLLRATSLGLSELRFRPSSDEIARPSDGSDAEARRILDAAIEQLQAYFDGRLRSFNIPLDLAGSDFQRRVWSVIAAIPYGETESYGTVAAAAGSFGAARAAGAACGANPVALIVPCHRVVASDGTLHGYGGGLDVKAWLLHHEGARLAGLQPVLALASA